MLVARLRVDRKPAHSLPHYRSEAQPVFVVDILLSNEQPGYLLRKQPVKSMDGVLVQPVVANDILRFGAITRGHHQAHS